MADQGATFSFRWGIPMPDGDFTTIPNQFFDVYRMIMGRDEWLFICHLARYKYESERGECYPSLKAIAQQMGYADDRKVRRIKSALVERGLLTVTYRDHQTSIYDFTRTSQQLMALLNSSSQEEMK